MLLSNTKHPAGLRDRLTRSLKECVKNWQTSHTHSALRVLCGLFFSRPSSFREIQLMGHCLSRRDLFRPIDLVCFTFTRMFDRVEAKRAKVPSSCATLRDAVAHVLA